MFGNPIYERIDLPATLKQQVVLNQLSPHQIATATLAGDTILAKMIEAPGNKVPIGGIKVVTENGWFAVRPQVPKRCTKYIQKVLRAESTLCKFRRKQKQ